MGYRAECFKPSAVPRGSRETTRLHANKVGTVVILVTLACSNYFKGPIDHGPSSYFIVLTLDVFVVNRRLFGFSLSFRRRLIHTLRHVIRTDARVILI